MFKHTLTLAANDVTAFGSEGLPYEAASPKIPVNSEDESPVEGMTIFTPSIGESGTEQLYRLRYCETCSKPEVQEIDF